MKRHQRMPVLLVAGTMAAGSCQAQVAPGQESVSGVQVGIGDCAFAEPRTDEGRERLGAAIAAAAISKGVNFLASAVTEAAKAKTWTATGARNFETTSAGFPQCVQVARGKFFSGRTTLGNWASAWGADRRAALEKNGLFLAETPEFFFEGEFIASEDKSALSIRPVYSMFGRPIGQRILRPGKERSVAIFFAITPPGTKPSLETAPAATIILGRQIPLATRTYPSTGGTYRSPMESGWFTLTKADTRKPFTVHALVTETQGADAFLAFIASVLSDEKVKTAITTETQQLLIPSVRAAAEDAEAATATKALNNADQLLAAALGKLETCRKAAPEAVVAAAAQAKIALRDYALADQALDTDDRTSLVGQTQLEQLDLTKPSTLKQACDSILQEIVGQE